MSDHDDRDLELDSILAPLSGQKPKPAQISTWASAMARAAARDAPIPLRRNYSLQLIAACLAGMILGGAVVAAWERSPSPASSLAERDEIQPSATIEHVFIKAN